jgi:hypothetical protein
MVYDSALKLFWDAIYRSINKPHPLRYYVAFVGGVSATAASPDGARALLAYLTSPTAVQVINDQGMDAGG